MTTEAQVLTAISRLGGEARAAHVTAEIERVTGRWHMIFRVLHHIGELERKGRVSTWQEPGGAVTGNRPVMMVKLSDG